MGAVTQELIVAVLVTCAAAYAGFRFMPAPWRRSAAKTAATFAERLGMSSVNARRVEAKLSTGGACGSCDSCKACATGQGGDEPAVPARPRNSFRGIPIRRVGR